MTFKNLSIGQRFYVHGFAARRGPYLKVGNNAYLDTNGQRTIISENTEVVKVAA